MIELKPHAEGAILPIHAHAGARRNEVGGIRNGRLKVSTTQAPEKGKANAALAKLLAGWLGLRRSQVALLSGETSPRKEFLILGLDCGELAQRIKAEFE
ncbi:MAG: DUF167 domain-containing protein [Thermoguttaceae bacterium]|nr:DUF167 domain-containing protein [Thermoguttaceae bacterium]